MTDLFETFAGMELIRELESPNGKRKVRVFQRADGFFEYNEAVRAFDELAGMYWSPRYYSGVFPTDEAVMHEILATILWLSEES